MTDSFLHSPEGRKVRWVLRSMRTRYLRIEGDPEQKARRGTQDRAAKTQQDLIDQLRGRNQRRLTGPVALDVVFHVNRSQPPSLQKLAKHLLDVIGAVKPGKSAPNRRHVVYQDDRQIKLLHVQLWKPADDSAEPGHTSIRARPLRDVAADLALVRTLEDGSMTRFGEDEGSRNDFPIPILKRSPRDASRGATEPAGRIAELSDWLEAFDHAQLQENLLADSDAHLARMLTRAPNWIAGVRESSRRYSDDPAFASSYAALDAVMAKWREMLLSDSLTAPLPGLPLARGEGREFKNAVRAAAEVMSDRTPLLAPLRVSLKVVLLVVPPRQGKDLDNLALTTIPVIRDALSAPDITAYEVIELKRTAEDPPEGHLRFALGSGSWPQSTWQTASDYVERCMEFD